MLQYTFGGPCGCNTFDGAVNTFDHVTAFSVSLNFPIWKESGTSGYQVNKSPNNIK